MATAAELLRRSEPRQSSGYPTFSNTEEDILEQLNTENFEIRLRVLNRLKTNSQNNPEEWFRTFRRKTDLFKAFGAVLQDFNWEVQHQCIKLLVDIMKDLGADKEWCMAIILPVLVPKLGSPKITVRRICVQALLTYGRLMGGLHSLLKALVNYALLLHKPTLTKEVLKLSLQDFVPLNAETALLSMMTQELPSLFAVDFASYNWSILVDGLTSMLLNTADDELIDLIMLALDKLANLVGQKEFHNLVNALSQGSRHHYEILLMERRPRLAALKTNPSNNNAMNGLMNAAASPSGQHGSIEQSKAINSQAASTSPVDKQFRYGIIPTTVLELLNNDSDARARLAGLEQLKSILEQLNEVGIRKLHPHLFSFFNLIGNILDDANLKVIVVALDCLRISVAKLQRTLESLLQHVIATLSKHFGSQKSVMRQLIMMTIMDLMHSLQPKPVVAALASSLQSKNPRVREEVLNILTVALLRYAPAQFNLTAVAHILGPRLIDDRKRIRLAAFECVAVLAHAMGGSKPEPLIKMLREAEQQSANARGLTPAVQARLARQKLPKIRPDGLLQYASPTDDAPGASNGERKAVGLDVDWIMSAGTDVANFKSRQLSSPPLVHKSKSTPVTTSAFQHQQQLQYTSPKLDSKSSSGITNAYASNANAFSPLDFAPTPAIPIRRVLSAGRSKKQLPWEHSSGEDERANHSAPVVRAQDFMAYRNGTESRLNNGQTEDVISSAEQRQQYLQAMRRAQANEQKNKTAPAPADVHKPIVKGNRRTSIPNNQEVVNGHHNVNHHTQNDKSGSNRTAHITTNDHHLKSNGHHQQGMFRKSLSLPSWQQPSVAPKRVLSPIDKSESDDESLGDNSPFGRATKFRGSAHRRRSSDVQNAAAIRQAISKGSKPHQHHHHRQHHDVRNSNDEDLLASNKKRIAAIKSDAPQNWSPKKEAHNAVVGNGDIRRASSYESINGTADDWDERPIKPAANAFENGVDSAAPSPTKKSTFWGGSVDNLNAANHSPKAKANISPRKPILRKNLSLKLKEKPELTKKPISPPEEKIKTPEQAIGFALKKIANEEWTDKVEGINAIQKQAEENAAFLGNPVQLHPVVVALLEEAKNLRSSVSRQALGCFSHLFAHLKKNMDPELDKVCLVLMAKTGDVSSAFIREDAQHALEVMVDNVTPSKALTALITAGATNKSAIIRNACSQLLFRLVELVGPTRTLNGTKDLTDKLLQAATQFVQDGQPLARYYGKAIINELSRDSDFDKVVKKSLPATGQKTVKDVLEQLKTKGLGEIPVPTGSANAVSTSSRSSTNAPSRTGSLRRKINEDVQDAITATLKNLNSGKWEDRLSGVQSFADLCKQDSHAVIPNIKLVDGYVTKLNDINSKVAVQALESFEDILPILAPHLGEALKTVAGDMIKNLMAQLPSKNDDLRTLALVALDASIKHADSGALVQPFCAAIKTGNFKQKPDMLYRLGEICQKAYPSKPKLVQINAVPVLTDLLKQQQGDNLVKQATAEFARSLGQTVGKKALLDQCQSSLNPNQLGHLKEMMESYN